MKKTRFVETIRVSGPCTQDWNGMVGNDQIRFCTHCAKDVNNLSAMTRKDAMRLVRRSNGKLCIRYIQHPETGAPLFSEQLIQISRRAPLFAAGLMGASLTLSTAAYAQGEARRPNDRPEPAPQVEQPLKAENDAQVEAAKAADARPESPEPSKVGSITGTVVDGDGVAVPGAAIVLRDLQDREIATTTTDEVGRYKFENVTLARYEVTASAVGLRPATFELRVRDASEKEANFELVVSAPIEVTGTVGITRIRYVGPLMRAIEDDEIEQVRELLSAGEDANHREDDDTTPLFVAVERGSVEMVRLLLDFGADVNLKDDEDRTPLMMIDDDASLELVELLLKTGAKVNEQDDEGNTALIYAARESTPEILQALLKAGAKIDVQNDEGMTALMAAADENDLENVRFLLNEGADVNLRDKDGDNAWDHATELAVEELLVAYGVVLDEEDEVRRKFYEPEEDDDEPEDEDEP